MFESMRTVVSGFQGVQKVGPKVYEKGSIKGNVAKACLSGMLRIAVATQSVSRRGEEEGEALFIVMKSSSVEALNCPPPPPPPPPPIPRSQNSSS